MKSTRKNMSPEEPIRISERCLKAIARAKAARRRRPPASACFLTVPAAGIFLFLTLASVSPAFSQPANDDFANAEVIEGATGTTTGNSDGATLETGEPEHDGVGTASIWWRWTAPANGIAVFDTFGSDFDTVLGVYTGELGALDEVAVNDDIGELEASRVAFPAESGVVYNIAVAGYDGETGNVVLAWTMFDERPANDEFANAIEISETEGSTTGYTFGAGVETGEPLHAGEGLASVWWRWTADVDGTMAFDTFQSDFDTVLAVYTGELGDLVEIAANDDADSLLVSQVTFEAVAGTTYHIAVAGHGGETGFVNLNWMAHFSAPNDDFADAQWIAGESGTATGNNLGASMEDGEPEHDGAGRASVWWRWTAPADRTAVFDTFGSDFDTVLAVYTGELGDLTTIASNDDALETLLSRVEFPAESGVTYHIAVSGYRGDTGFITLNWNTFEPPPNDRFSDATVISGTSGSVTGNSFGASMEDGEPEHDGVGSASVWWRWTAPADGMAIFDTFDSDFDTVLAVYTGALGDLVEIAANDDAAPNTRLSRVQFSAASGVTYHIAVSGYEADTGSIVLNWTMPDVTPPSINFESWAEQLPDGTRAATDDPGGFGIENLLRYAFNLDPMHPSRNSLPQSGRVAASGNGHNGERLTLQFTRRLHATDIEYLAEVSDDMKNWIPIVVFDEIVVDDENGETETVTLIDSEWVSDNPIRFIRVKITRST